MVTLSNIDHETLTLGAIILHVQFKPSNATNFRIQSITVESVISFGIANSRFCVPFGAIRLLASNKVAKLDFPQTGQHKKLGVEKQLLYRRQKLFFNIIPACPEYYLIELLHVPIWQSMLGAKPLSERLPNYYKTGPFSEVSINIPRFYFKVL